MPKDYRRDLQGLLRKLFQFDSADLDFGIYRIMNYKRDEIEKFIEDDLIKAVDVEFEKYSAKSKEEIEKELVEITKRISSTLGEDALFPSGDIKEMYRGSPIAKEFYKKKEELKNIEMADQHKTEIFSHIYQFFSRYYDEGDFISLRRYSRQNKYAVPYNGEEVLLHWANRDQYYIKTGEYFKNYAFKIGDYTINFGLADAEIGHNNNGSANRFFLLKDSLENIAYDESTKELNILFEYRPLTTDEITEFGTRDTQKRILDEVQAIIITKLNNNILKGALQKQEGERTLLAKHLFRYTKRNTADYFIHRDLSGFLSGELDFYIKNEVFMIDDLGSENEVDIEGYIGRINIIKSISNKIINFLTQIEEFQKKLWLKKKFVTETSWCIAISTILEIEDDIICKDIFTEIINNSAQRKEWIRLLSIDEIQPNLEAPGYSVPLTGEFLTAHPTLMVDTRHFSPEFTTTLLQAINDIDEQTDGVLIHSENFQALNLIRERYLKQIECIHIDPPYNTQTSGFLYKNNYQHSSWLAMMYDRLEAARDLISTTGTLLCHIDENEYEKLALMSAQIQLPNSGTVIWDKKNPMLGRKGVATQHEYVLWCADVAGPIYLRNATQRLILETARNIIQKHGGVTDGARDDFSKWISTHKGLSGGERAYRFLNDDGRVFQSAGMAAPERRTDPKFFIPLIHPITGKPCPAPAYGWSRAPETLQKLIACDEIIFGKDETTQPRRKLFLSEDSRRQISSVIQDANRGKADMDKLGLEFPYCHPLSLYIVLDGAASPSSEGITLDFFAGSGTNGHALIALNRDEKTHRKFILVEMAKHFDTVLLPRLKKVTFTPEWKDGKPNRLATREEIEHSPRIFKIVRLESYEDTLNNIEYFVSGEIQRTLEDLDGYFLRYMLDFETRDSPCRLNIDMLNRPFDYTLKITRDNEVVNKKVDLVETFNYLLGLHVKRINVFNNNCTHYKVIHGSKDEDKITIIWRDTDILDLEADKAFIEDHILKEFRANRVYVNSDCFVEGVIQIEPEFKRLMGA